MDKKTQKDVIIDPPEEISHIPLLVPITKRVVIGSGPKELELISILPVWLDDSTVWLDDSIIEDDDSIIEDPEDWTMET